MQNKPEFYDVVSVTPDNPRSGEGDMAVLRDGRVLFAYTSFRGREDDARADIVDCFSADGGRTWSTPTVLVSNDEARENVMSASLLRLQSGAILLFYLRKDSRCDCRVWMRRSDDEAETWSDAVCCTSATRYFVIVNDCALQLADGRIVLPLESCEEVWTADEHIEASAVYSDDDGCTWSESNRVFAPERGAMEPMIVEKRDGRLWMLMRTDQGTLWESFSSDRGATWDESRDGGIESPQSPFVFKRMPSTGDLLLIRNPVARLDQGTHQGFRTPLACSISKDDGATWANEKLLEADTSRTYCYVSATFADDILLLSYYVGSMDMPLECLRVARVPLGWLYDGG